MRQKRPDGWAADAVGIYNKDGRHSEVRLSRRVGGSELVSEGLTLDEARALRRELKQAIRAIENPDFWRKADDRPWSHE